jgi:hypothetical protein
MPTFLTDLLVVLVIALVLTAIFAVGIRKRKAWSVIISFFAVLLLSTWAVGAWINPAPLRGAPWLSFLLVGILFALLLTVLIPLAKYAKGGATEEAEEKEIAIVTFDLFFWVLVVGLIAAIIVRYVPFGR